MAMLDLLSCSLSAYYYRRERIFQSILFLVNISTISAIHLIFQQLGGGGASGYSFDSWVKLEGEFYLMSSEAGMLYGVSGALLFNVEILNNTYYILGGVSTLEAFEHRGAGASMFLMLGGGMKLAIQKEKNYRIRFALRWHPAEAGCMRVSIGLMWLFH